MKLREERVRLVQAHLAGAVPLDLLKAEQDRILREMTVAETRLGVATAEHKDAEAVFAEGSALLRDPVGLWHRLRTDDERRQYLLVFFTRLRLDGPAVAKRELTPQMQALTDAIDEVRAEYHRTRPQESADLRQFITAPDTMNPPGQGPERVRLSAVWSG